ncbi:Gfo/Idh/MocA family oxidoreductase [Arenibacter sp. BSSL-BM3]|uniref:Gfo/Idh/MocA family oxidoreductase n=1 Tax=Arenibacter arenosicollis TaxID=2762274 RepID=A0ABR7QJI4_9FLAO|nr:Gfo/Idh/MocA family oxidoreductase [Arenibacter arenosicollis]MBC8767341.1 Gfo/Idh/MocA family oxidoreductase [Arenibacter arenosicollis]
MKPINTALCSFGMSGVVFHAPFIDVHPGFNLYGVWERTKNNAQAKYPNVKTFRRLEDMLADNNIELVVVNTPSVTHYDFTKQAINSGKNVIVEKPFTATVAQAEELIQLAKEKKVTLSVYHNRRYDSDFKTIKKVMDEGWLGNIVEAEIHYDRYDPVLSYKIHKETPTAAVGGLYDLGSHLIDQALVLFGMPNAIYADMDTFRPNSKVEDYFDVKLIYNTHRVTLKSSYYVREVLPGNILHGTKGSFIKSKADVQEAALQAGKIPGTQDWGAELDKEKGLLHTEKDGKIIREYVPTLNGDYMAYYEGIYQALRNNKSVPVSATDGMNVIKVIEAAIKSNKEKRVLEL